jgi:uncharacterized protein YecE (DUF72 family)
VLCATDLDEGPPPDLRRTGSFLYLRLRRASYNADELDAWAARLTPFLVAGVDAFAFLRHDADGEAAERARALARAVERLLAAEVG